MSGLPYTCRVTRFVHIHNSSSVQGVLNTLSVDYHRVYMGCRFNHISLRNMINFLTSDEKAAHRCFPKLFNWRIVLSPMQQMRQSQMGLYAM